jgi:oligoendopeptidase F
VFDDLPANEVDLLAWNWGKVSVYYADLSCRPLNAASLADWLADWSALAARLDEQYSRLYRNMTANTADTQAASAFHAWLEGVYPPYQQAEFSLKQKLLRSGLTAPGFEIPLRNMRAEVGLYREENLLLLVEEQKLAGEYDRIVGAQTVVYAGRELALSQLQNQLQDPRRDVREGAWRATSQRQLQDRAEIDALWQKLLRIRMQIAANAGLPDFRAYRWQQLMRFDYSPQDCLAFHAAIESAVVPAANRIYAKRARQLGLTAPRPWDLDVDPHNRQPLAPFDEVDQLVAGLSAIFQRMSPVFGQRFDQMAQNGLLDLDNRMNKAPGGYCVAFASARVPFIFMNAVGLHNDVQTLLHESGHAFHVFECAGLPYFQQTLVPAEFAEVASMSMELLGSRYLSGAEHSFYSPADAGRALSEHLESMILFWPYMAVVDAFQHWVYTHAQAALDARNCDACWRGLTARFMPGVDWSGLPAEMETGWHRKEHIHTLPFYYVEYGLSQLGAVQVWRNSLEDETRAIVQYRHGLSLGGTVSLPDLYRATGAQLSFDAAALSSAVALIESRLAELSGE